MKGHKMHIFIILYLSLVEFSQEHHSTVCEMLSGITYPISTVYYQHTIAPLCVIIDVYGHPITGQGSSWLHL